MANVELNELPIANRRQNNVDITFSTYQLIFKPSFNLVSKEREIYRKYLFFENIERI